MSNIKNDITPCVLIATHQRLAITSTNIKTLQQQTLPPTIVIVCTDPYEAGYYHEIGGVRVIEAKNEPLGAKWQSGVDYCRKLNPSHLIITGSDDILCNDFVQRFCTDAIIGLQRWYIFSPPTGRLYLFDYLAKQPLGGGRIYNRLFLDSCDWQLFDTGAGKLLDDKGWRIVKKPGAVIRLIDNEGCILAVKGNWPVMNPLDITLQHRNARLVKQWEGDEALFLMAAKFNYIV